MNFWVACFAAGELAVGTQVASSDGSAGSIGCGGYVDSDRLEGQARAGLM